MVSACEAHGVRLMANENWRWQPWWREIHRLERSGDLGQLVGVHLFLRPGDGWGPEPYRQQPFFRNLEKFLLFETGCHYFDTMRFLCGEVDTVYCHTRHLNSAIRGEDAAHAVCCHVNGVVSIFDGNRAVATAAERPAANGWAVIEGSDASLRLAADGSLWLTPRGKPERRHEFTVTTGYRGGSAVAAQAHFVAGLRHKAPFETEGRDYLKTEALVAAAYRSAESGQTEKPADFLR
jgi:predicted dehydrogenase